MAVYRARWFCPVRLKPLFRDFHSKSDAVAFRDLPREAPVVVDYYRTAPDHRT